MGKARIVFSNVTKKYDVSRIRYGLLMDFINEKFLSFLNRQRKIQNTIYALRNISFTIPSGETWGIIGRNGAGKSTILKLISKISYPEAGKIIADGKIGAFIELGAGLHYELTGRENIFLYGAILGMKRREIAHKFGEIVEFAGIRKFLDLPIKKYSSGMYARLGFSVCAFCDPDILLVDEVLAVGDYSFQKKCIEKMNQFKQEGKTIVFVSHNMEAVCDLCDKVIYLDKGRVKKKGEARNIVRYYLEDISG